MNGNTETIVCRVCNLVKPVSEYPIRNEKTGLRHTRCRECGNEYVAAYKRKQRAEAKANEAPKDTSSRTCKKCGVTQPIEQFAFSNKRRGHRRCRCRACDRVYHMAYRMAGSEVLKAKRRRHYENCVKPRQVNDPEWLPRRRARANRRGAELRQEVLAGYGPSCACCGETMDRFLTIDHVDGDGKIGRKRVLTGSRLYLHLIRRRFPPEFQVLCFNCNLGKAKNGGVCPHKTGSTTISKESRAQAIGARSAPHPSALGDDMVCSAQECAAASEYPTEAVAA